MYPQRSDTNVLLYEKDLHKNLLFRNNLYTLHTEKHLANKINIIVVISLNNIINTNQTKPYLQTKQLSKINMSHLVGY